MVDHPQDDGTPPSPRVAILGAGMSGICMGIQLAKAGIHSFTLYEKAHEIGGTWRDNTYPGCSCDVPSHLYTFSFEPEPDWSRMFAEQPEILRYFRRCADAYGLGPHVRTRTEITRAHFDEESQVWRLYTREGQEHTAEVLVCACGQLHRPYYPDIPGIDRFEGTLFHSARWNHGHDLSGEHVAVIGNAASAIQFIPRIAPQVERLTIFQRSPNWVFPKPDRVYSRLEKWLFRRFPVLARLYRSSIYWRLEARFLAFAKASWVGRLAERVARKHLEEQIADPALREKLTPDYPVGCKRILISNDYYPTLERSNVDLVTDPIERISAKGVHTRDGSFHRADTIILATGFEATRFLAPMEIQGRAGKSLQHAWQQGAEAYLGLTVPGFPNFFVLYGPNTNLGHNSIMYMVESQVDYVVQCIEAMRRRGLSSVDVREDVMERYNREIQSLAGETVWAADCASWYKNESGRLTNNWPDWTFKYHQRLRRPDLSDYNLQPPTGAYAASSSG